MKWRLAVLSLVLSAGAAHGAEGRPTGGIWKNVVPKDIRAEFGREDVMGLVAGVHIATDCSINWIDPDTDKRYCFASGTSLVFFQREPKANLEKARKFLEDEEGQSSAPTN